MHSDTIYFNAAVFAQTNLYPWDIRKIGGKIRNISLKIRWIVSKFALSGIRTCRLTGV